MKKLFITIIMLTNLTCFSCEKCIEEFKREIEFNQTRIKETLGSTLSLDIYNYYYLLGYETAFKFAKDMAEKNHSNISD